MVSTAYIDQHLLRPRVLQLYTRCPFEPAQCNCAFHCVFMYQSECSVTFMKLLFYCIHIWAFWKVQECFSNWLLANLGEIWATANLMEQLWIPQQFIWWLILQFQHSEGWNVAKFGRTKMVCQWLADFSHLCISHFFTYYKTTNYSAVVLNSFCCSVPPSHLFLGAFSWFCGACRWFLAQVSCRSCWWGVGAV